MRVGFVGLGRMGLPMARNLQRKGFDLVVHNRSRAPVEKLATTGAQPAAAPREVAQLADIVFTCLPDTSAVEEVYLGDDGLLTGARAGAILVDLSTVGPATSRHLARRAAAQGLAFLDAPVSGGTAGAEAGTLTVIIGGDAAAVQSVRPVLEAVAQRIHHVGPNGAGSVIKLANQLLVAINLAGAVEAMVLGTKAGADPQVMLDVLSSSFGSSTMLTRCVPMMLARQFDPGTPIKILRKDLGLISELADESDVRLLLGSLAREVFAEARGSGLDDRDIAALVEPLERLAGVKVQRRA